MEGGECRHRYLLIIWLSDNILFFNPNGVIVVPFFCVFNSVLDLRGSVFQYIIKAN